MPEQAAVIEGLAHEFKTPKTIQPAGSCLFELIGLTNLQWGPVRLVDQ